MSAIPAAPALVRTEVPDDAAPAARFAVVRGRSRALAAPLSPEDATVQSMGDASPSKWHLAHTSWFFEQFVLGMRAGYQPVHAHWGFLFNSYYNAVGPMHARPQRGLLTRPTLAQVLDYRDQVDARMADAFACGDVDQQAQQRVTLGLHHEQQHQELLLTDIKHAFSRNPLHPAYRQDLYRPNRETRAAPALRWIAGQTGIVEIGAPPWPQHSGFAFDSEAPRHRTLLHPHALASRPTNNAEYRAFIDDGGYRTATLWMSEAWTRIQNEGWPHPLYWDDALECEFTLGGLREIDPHAPVCHLSYYEADAFARWAGARLPTEPEWEHAATVLPVSGNFVEADALHPMSCDPRTPPQHDNSGNVEHIGGLQQMFGDVWEWTASAYAPYPGFRALPGALGEYNGKFMCGQWVLRGGSCASPREHLRASYRNFFYPPDRWQFSGVRLAKDLP